MKLYTIYDKLAEEAGPIFECKNDRVAWSSILDIVKKDPSRYDLMRLGYFSHDPVALTTEASPQVVFYDGTLYQEDN